MTWKKGKFLYKGKAKNVYSVFEDSSLVWLEFTDDLTAFNGKKRSSFPGKGCLNRDMSSQIFRYLKKEHIENHWIEDKESRAMICRKLKILSVEVVVRNKLAGTTARRFAFPEGHVLSRPLVEFYYKNDDLNDPFISSEQALAFGYISCWEDINTLKDKALAVNKKLKTFFAKVGIELIDFKLEFGRKENTFVLGDEISCDSCRLWEKNSGEKLDKDRFRLGLGRVQESYQKVNHLLKSNNINM